MVEQSYSPHGEPDTETAQSEPCSGPEGRAARIQRMPSLICCCTHVNCIWKDPHGREVRSTSLPSVSQSNEVDGEDLVGIWLPLPLTTCENFPASAAFLDRNCANQGKTDIAVKFDLSLPNY